MDKLTAQQRHANMAAIRSKDTKPEMVVRRGLWKRGFRYRLNHWHESKKRVSQDRWLSAIRWMRENGFAPDNNNN